jgi:hypothetical protein
MELSGGAIRLADLNGDGKLETGAASRNYLLDAARDLAVGDLTYDGRPEIVCGGEDGQVKIAAATGQIIAWYQTGGWVRQVRTCELDGDPATEEIVATCDDGGVYGLQVR